MNKNVIRIALGASLALMLPACSATLHRAPVTTVQRVNDWAGIDRLSHCGKLYFGGQPTPEALQAAQARGIRVVVNLRSERETEALEFDEAALVRDLGIDYVTIPVTRSTFGPADAERLKQVLAKTPGPVLIHCASSNRVGAVWALYLHRYRDVSMDDAIELGRKAGLRSEALVEIIRHSDG